MESLNLAGTPQIFIGIYLIFHGLIHSLFLNYSLNADNRTYTGWSGKSWLLDTILNSEYVDLIGKVTWFAIIILFIVSGLGILGVPILKNYAEIVIIFSSILAIIAFLVFFNGLHPTPYNFLIGIAIDIVFLIYVILYPKEQTLAIISLTILFILGMIVVFVSDVIPLLVKSTT